MADPTSFEIKWRRDGVGYAVSIPNYDGGTVYTAEHVDRLTRENGELKAALMSCRTSYDGYQITSNDQYAQVIGNFWRELQRIDKAARTALKEPCK